MNRRYITAACCIVLVSFMSLPNANADPCGMVPPIYTGNINPITRIGLQKTYVFYKDGVETFVIRPGFQGNVDEFGMLIPFPTPPEIRKVADNVFEQVGNAIDPPEVVVDLRRMRRMYKQSAPMSTASGVDKKMEVAKDAVTVLKQEAVGMYEVAVLEAGSPAALKRWMDEHGFQYPKGMDSVTGDYVESGWCFVAVKTKVGEKNGVEPRPGQRDANAKMPKGGVFDGHVQGMGFRFRTDEFVVPMRLSAFNEGDLRNVVYILSDSPRRIRSIPEEYVQRQISGDQLVKNVSDPLPLRIIGGTEKDIPQYRRDNLDKERDPATKNGIAKELFASDLLAVSTGQLSLEHEEQEKELLRIGEQLGLRGPEIDSDNAVALKKRRTEITKAGLTMLNEMTLSVIDGDFPREVIARDNLTFANYNMPAERNAAESYDSKMFGPGGKKEGVLHLGWIDWADVDRQIAADKVRSRRNRTSVAWLVSLVALGMVMTLAARKRAAFLTVLIACLATTGTLAQAQDKPKSLDQVIEQLKDSKTADQAIEAAVEMAKDSDQRDGIVKGLLGIVTKGEDLPQRGWAIAALAEIGGTDVDEALLDVHANESTEKVVRTWAAAARVSMTRSVNGLIEKANLIPQFPALGRPIGMRLVEQMNVEGEEVDPEKMIQATIRVPQLQQGLAPAIIAFGPAKLTQVVYSAENNDIRRTGAGYLGSIAQAGQGQDVVDEVVKTIAFDAQASDVPWKGGALFIPNVQWDKENATALVGNLIRWHVWCDMNDKNSEQQQIHNNIRSVALIQAAGYGNPGWNDVGTVEWLNAWKTAVGKDGIRKVLEDVGALDNDKYASLLD